MTNLLPHIYLAGYILYTLIVAAIIFLVITDDKSPIKSLAWVMVLVFIPVAGIVLYLVFGQNYRKKKIFSRKGLEDFRQLEKMRFQQLEYLESPHITKDKAAYKKQHIMKLLLNNSKSILSANNRVDILNSGQEKFDALIQDLKAARHHIHLEYYIFDDDEIGRKIAGILMEKAKEGVKVRLIMDHVGSWHFKRSYLKRLRENGVEAELFMKVRFPLLTSKINYRNHRKIVVVDGKIGYVGGINIADRYIHGTEALGSWRDIHLRLRGDAIHSLQTVFLTDWYFITRQLPGEDVYFPKTKQNGDGIVQIVSSGPDSNWAGIMHTYFSAIATARKHIYITTPYLLPNSSILTALKTAALAGVDVRIIIPRKSDAFIVHYASLSYIRELLIAGIKVYFYKEGFIHSKMTVVDGILSSVGTANMDYRSFSLNFEVNALIYNKDTATDLTAIFKEDLNNSQKILLEQWEQRSRWEILRSSIARLFSPLL